MNNPILIAAVPRSGSSLIAKIFVEHGIWCGDCKVKSDQYETPVPYPAFENIAIDDWIYSQMEFRSEKVCDFDDLMRAINPGDLRWLYKGKPRFIHYILKQIPNEKPFIVKTKRVEENIIKSWGFKPSNLVTHLNALQMLHGEVVDVDAVMARNFKTLEFIFDKCGLEFNRDIAESCIDDGLWHYAA